MKKLGQAVVSSLFLGLLLPISACSDKVEPTVEAIKQPLKQKIEALMKRVESGDAEAEADLAEVYASGEGLPKDSVKAADLFRKAAGKGIAKAQYRLGQMYARGEGVEQDSVKALDLTKQAAKNGYAKAQSALGAMYAKGEGVDKDEVLAYVWSSLAVAQGEEDARQTQDSVTLDTVLRDEAERLKSKWKRGVEIVREQQEKAVPSEPAKTGGVKW